MPYTLTRRTMLAGLTITLATSVALPSLSFAQEYSAENPLKVIIVLDGALGDKSFLDSAAAGVNKAVAELPVTAKIVESGYDPGKWEPALQDAADGDYDLIICGTFNMAGFLAKIAPQYPEKKFIIYDDTVDFASGNYPNVLSIQFLVSTGGYLAGYAAGKVSATGTIATIVGLEIPGVMDFKVGFDQGAKAANPDIEILNVVAGVFNDPAKGKEIALAQLSQGADVIFPIAGATGIGALQAVRDAGALAIGVDSDQATIFAVTDQAQADVIATSVEKKVGEALFLAIGQTIEGNAPYGTELFLGLKEGVVGISKNEYYKKLIPEDVRLEIEAISEEIITGTLAVDSAMIK